MPACRLVSYCRYSRVSCMLLFSSVIRNTRLASSSTTLTEVRVARLGGFRIPPHLGSAWRVVTCAAASTGKGPLAHPRDWLRYRPGRRGPTTSSRRQNATALTSRGRLGHHTHPPCRPGVPRPREDARRAPRRLRPFSHAHVTCCCCCCRPCKAFWKFQLVVAVHTRV